MKALTKKNAYEKVQKKTTDSTSEAQFPSLRKERKMFYCNRDIGIIILKPAKTTLVMEWAWASSSWMTPILVSRAT